MEKNVLPIPSTYSPPTTSHSLYNTIHTYLNSSRFPFLCLFYCLSSFLMICSFPSR
ncbi:hypothetical protein BJY00DRAFT_170196 [Aspergillus carlsbadensis]|nr:hypothetical protein BJY00DRAFT_170196 [Aspergillus carlsbadensis]